MSIFSEQKTTCYNPDILKWDTAYQPLDLLSWILIEEQALEMLDYNDSLGDKQGLF